MTATVDVLICVHTSERWCQLCQALESIRRQTVSPRKVVLVVDHNDALLERARRTFADVQVVGNDHARGLGGARNAGVDRCTAEVVACLDDDAVADRRWLQSLIREYEGEDVLGVGGIIRPAWGGSRPPWFPDEFGWVVGCSYRGLPERRASVRNLIGANMSIRRDVLLDLGGFSERLGRKGLGFGGHEETELCIRGLVRFPGARWIYTPHAAVAHSVSRARATWSYFVSRCHGEGFSKASMTQVAGVRMSLESELAYVLKTVPMAVVRGLFDLLRGDWAGPLRSVAVLGGVAATALGYGRGLVSAKLGRRACA